MHLYWKIFEELKLLGEYPVLLDPSLKRCFKHWMETHQYSLTMAEQRHIPMFPGPEAFGVTLSLN
ncbi:hypothetical protein [Desulfatibacillum aliphaticivorans]|uniref:hypothetical protein n=1 Tax=Desulfatibacillum aliphaticivorans TaxID=218208 RepID=UPI00040E590D|nr:hypothetical protein [Desulfatibacillum aliphaticivorans]